MENNKKESRTILLMGITMVILGCIIGWLLNVNHHLEKENKVSKEQIEKLEKNQKPRKYLDESGYCAGC